MIGQSVPSSLNDKTIWNDFTYDIGNIFYGIGHTFSSPVRWKGNQWIGFSALITGTGLVYLMDEPANDFFMELDDKVPQIIQEYGTNYGSPTYNYLFTGGVYLSGLFGRNEKLRRTGVLLVASASAVGLLQQLTKSLTGRSRPLNGKSKDTFDPFNSHRNYHSFFSGHAALAFSNAYALGKQFRNPWIKGGLYAVGLIPGFSRLWDDQHWLSDVVLGVALSILTVESIDKYLDGKYHQKYNNTGKKLDWDLNFGMNNVGVLINF
ncbi:phosphatase PAP2 family protein [Flagellimonas sp. 2504JD4-2]